MKNINYKQIIKYAGNIITILSIIFVIRVAMSLNINLSIIEHPILFTFILILCSMIICISVFLLAYGWKTVLSVLAGKKVQYRTAVCIYTKANMGKYLPGNVMHYVERNLFASSLGLEQKAVFLTTLTEIAGLISVCVIFGIITMRNQIITILNVVIKQEYIIVFTVIFFLLLILVILFWNRINNFLAYIPKKFLLFAFLKTVPIYFFSIILSGCTLVVLFATLNLSGMTLGIMFTILGAYIISWVIGFVVPGSPGGIGVREFVLLFLLKTHYTEDLVVTCILIHRFASILGDILAYLASLGLKKWNERKLSKIL